MFANKFVVALKSNGKVLRENKDTCFLPFGGEYSIFLKNLNSLRAAVSVSIDGKDVLNGSQLVINGNSELNLERFLSDNMNEGRRFRFIERTSEIEDHRGIDAEDGIIRVEFQYEKYVNSYVTVAPYTNPDRWSKEPYGPLWNTTSSGAVGQLQSSYSANASSVPLSGEVKTSGIMRGQAVPTMDSCISDITNDAGITVEGSKSRQAFTTTTLGVMENEKHVIVLQLKGVNEDAPIVAPVTVKTKKYCTSCGREWAFKYEYCPKDGTFLKSA